jgi:hypothetical protein
MSASRQERKVVTALFCDLVGFTSQAEEMDPEDVASLPQGDLSFAARVRLPAFRQLASEGRRADIDELLPKVLAFYRTVGATRFVREAEELRASVA